MVGWLLVWPWVLKTNNCPTRGNDGHYIYIYSVHIEQNSSDEAQLRGASDKVEQIV